MGERQKKKAHAHLGMWQSRLCLWRSGWWEQVSNTLIAHWGKKKKGVQHKNELLVTVTALQTVTSFSGRGEKIYDKHILPTET